MTAMPEPVALHSPIQRELFPQSGNRKHTEVRKKASIRYEVEAIVAIRRSTEQLRERYNFDLNQMESTSTKRPKSLSLQSRMISCSEPTSPLVSDIPQMWHWEKVDLEETYVAEFYHTRLYNSDSNLVLTSNRVKTASALLETPPCTPHKSIRSPSTHKLHCSDGSTESRKENTLLQLWHPRIKRNPNGSMNGQYIEERIKKEHHDKASEISKDERIIRSDNHNSKEDETQGAKQQLLVIAPTVPKATKGTKTIGRIYRQLTLLDFPRWHTNSESLACTTSVV